MKKGESNNSESSNDTVKNTGARIREKLKKKKCQKETKR